MSNTAIQTKTIAGLQVVQPQTIQQAYNYAKPYFDRVFGERASEAFATETGFAKQLVLKNPKLAEDLEGVMMATINVALTGLSFNPSLGLAYLVPRKDKGVSKTHLDIGYKGYVNILYQESGIVVYSDIIYSCDEWEVSRGSNALIFHKPNYESQEIQKALGAYSVAIFPDGRETSHFMPRKDILKRKAVSMGASSRWSPWVKWEEEMWKKTVIRAHFNTLPKGQKSGYALASDNQANPIEETEVSVEEKME